MLKQKMESLGIRCELRKIAGAGADRRDKAYVEMVGLFGECFRRP